jgi:hypothetical protein
MNKNRGHTAINNNFLHSFLCNFFTFKRQTLESSHDRAMSAIFTKSMYFPKIINTRLPAGI